MATRVMRAALLSVFLILFSAGLASAQVSTATIYGTVTDATGALIPNASVELLNEATGQVVSAKSDARGDFSFTFVPVGRYTLKLSASGFQSQARSGLQLGANQSVRLDLSMQVGEVREAVTVTGEAPLVNAVNAQQVATLGTTQVRELPLARRDWTSMLRLGTGVTTTGSSGVSINGLAPASFNLTVDGTNASSDPELPSLGMYQDYNVIKGVSVEAVQEVSITKGIASAEIGATMSGNVNLITRGGTNQFNGSLFWNNQLDNYNARNQFLAIKPGAVFNQFGGSFGGPIVRNKVFFFTTYEGLRDRTATVVQGNVPTPEFRAQVLAAQPAYRPWLDLFAAPNQPYSAGAVSARFVTAASQPADDNHAVARVDYNLNDTNMLSMRYTRSRPNKLEPRFIEQNSRQRTGTSEVGTLNYTHTSASMVAATRFGYNRMSVLRLDRQYIIDLANISVSGIGGSGAETFFKEGSILSIEQTFSKMRGRHSLKAGVLFQRGLGGRDNAQIPDISYSSVADFLANIPNQVTFTFGAIGFQLQSMTFGGFLQDDFKVNRRLMLNFGLRYDYFTVPEERDGRIFNGGAPFGFGPPRPVDSLYEADRNNFAPRVGFAYNLDNAGKTVLRGGVGIFVNPHPLFGGPIETAGRTATVPFRLTLSRAEALALGIRFPITNEQALPRVTGVNFLASNTSVEANFPNPYSSQWTLNLERQLTGTMALETAYVANRGVKLNLVRIMNFPDRQTGIRPVAGFGQFRYYDASATSSYQSWQTTLRKRFSQGLTFNISHTWGKTLSLSPGGDLLLEDRPQDNNNVASDWGPAPYDIRHRFTSDFVYELPFARLASNQGGATRLLLGGWQVAGIFTALTGNPVNITDSASAYDSSRPDYVGGDPYLDDYRDTLNYLNTRVFSRVPIVRASGATERPGNIGRHALRAPGSWVVDLALSKSLAFNERWKLQIRADLFNAFNHTNLGGLTSNINSGTFGRLTSATARTGQLNLRLTF